MSRVLIAEDEPRIAAFIEKGLRSEGFTPTVARDGVTGFDYAVSGEFDLAVLDIGLPGMDGYQVAQRLRIQPGLEKTLLVAMTGYGQEEDRRRSRAAGFNQHLVKPVDLETLEMLLACSEWRPPLGSGAASATHSSLRVRSANLEPER